MKMHVETLNNFLINMETHNNRLHLQNLFTAKTYTSPVKVSPNDNDPNKICQPPKFSILWSAPFRIKPNFPQECFDSGWSHCLNLRCSFSISTNFVTSHPVPTNALELFNLENCITPNYSKYMKKNMRLKARDTRDSSVQQITFTTKKNMTGNGHFEIFGEFWIIHFWTYSFWIIPEYFRFILEYFWNIFEYL